MNTPKNEVFSLFIDHIGSEMKSEDLNNMIAELDHTLVKSKNTRKQILDMYNNLHIKKSLPEVCDKLNNYDTSQFLDAECNLLLPDVEYNSLNTEDAKNKLKTRNVIDSSCKKQRTNSSVINKDVDVQCLSNLKLDEYAENLKSMKQHINHFNLIKNGENLNERDIKMEEQLLKLIDDSELFNNMINAQISLADCQTKWSKYKEPTDAFTYSQVMQEMLTKLNEVIYTTSKKNKV